MSDTENGNGSADQAPAVGPLGQGAADAQQQAQQPPRMNVLAQYIRDMSFENILVQQGGQAQGQPDVQVRVNLDAKRRQAENQYEVSIKLNIDSKSKESGSQLFLLEIDYAGVFSVENVPENQLHPYLLIECPRMLFPYLRRIVSDVSRDGGYPPLNLENIDFLQIYRNEIIRRQSEQPTKDATPAGPTGTA
ncbi:MAG: protein-export chaperone SecB [Rhodobacteraceae bacterium HLUCCA24]|nr:MAG: protein-export chaperone SecB [Rhodobacteraceae bacterium HLUCCA24]